MSIINQYYPESVTNPSEFLKEALEEHNIGAKEFAVKTGKPEKTVSAVLSGESSITPEMAVLFQQVLKIPAHFWNEAQKNYDEYIARVNYQQNIESAIDWAKTFPYAKMVKLNWVPSAKKNEERVINLFEYFGVASQKGYEDYYYHQRTKAAFRISLKDQAHASVIATWLRQGEIQSKSLEVDKYRRSKLKDAMPQLKNVMASQPEDFFMRMQEICAECGVKVVYTPSLPNAAIHGSTRWFGDTPLIQLSGRFKRNDIFWFTFFHEIGHIILHGKTYISVENIKVVGENDEYEKEANIFASEWMLSEKELEEILERPDISNEDIVEYAEKFETHPACIVGRIQYMKLLRYGIGNQFFEPISLE
jgi:plasmid maintenance system antidote protein VapI/Zn-dependent peptidase ImmA (M78 family)